MIEVGYPDGGLGRNPFNRLVKSVQHFDITIAASGTSNTATIRAVDTSRSAVVWDGFLSSYAATGGDTNSPRVDLTNSTTVTARRNTSAAHTVQTRGCVIEFFPWAIQSIQAGTITVNSATASGTATITAVDTTRSAVLWLGQTTTNASTSPASYQTGTTLTNATTVTATRGNGASTGILTVGYVVVEFRPGVLRSVQQYNYNTSSASSSYTQAINAVDTRNSVIFFGGSYANSTSELVFFASVVLTNSTTVTMTRNGTTTTSRNHCWAVLEFNPGFIRSNNAGTVTIATSASSGTVTLNPVILEQTAVFFNGWNNANDTDARVYSTVHLSNTTTLTATRQAAATGALITGYQAVEFL